MNNIHPFQVITNTKLNLSTGLLGYTKEEVV